ncbi:anaerobic sulfatase maturase [Lentibacillus saliphilus]|uniref:anaerobic sulfatase maturase n=1 Tax=Lentibacillus saliphilus TaxID=2737028 RepID=UPI001C2F1A6D|nr:anaerobic sulfatase maturase [Lentibacillus saliphilus]
MTDFAATTEPLNRPHINGVMWKTVSEACNLACDYCYYSRCNGKPGKINRIADDVLEKFMREYMELKRGIVPFAWQGGEPLLAGLDFFKKVVSLQAKHAPKNTIISNSIQTNGILINEEWAEFFKTYNFLVGVSLDGPKDINDARRVTGSGKGSFDLITRGIDHLRNAGVEFNILTVIHENNVGKAAELMAFYEQEGYTHVQFIPCMEFQSQDTSQPGRYLISPEQYGTFLCEAFDHWYRDGSPTISIRFFDNILSVYSGYSAEMCAHMETCPRTIIFEQNGDAYPCDFFIDDDFRLGNIAHDSLARMLQSEKMDQFLAMKPELNEACKSCEFLHLCHGGCPRNRIQDDGSRDVEYFCESYKMIYHHAHKRMEQLGQTIKKNRLLELIHTGQPLPGRNDLCICNSGKKFKKCCEPLL